MVYYHHFNSKGMQVAIWISANFQMLKLSIFIHIKKKHKICSKRPKRNPAYYDYCGLLIRTTVASAFLPLPRQLICIIDFIPGLNGAMSNISMSYNRPGSTTSSSTSMSRAPMMEEILFHHHHHPDDLPGWGCSSDHHHNSRKRHGSSSATDVNMESPSRKRGKYL